MGLARQLTSSPRYAVAIIVTLGIGLTATATFTALVEDLFLRPPTGVSSPRDVRVLSGTIVESGRSGIGFEEKSFEALEKLEPYGLLAAFSGIDIEVTMGAGLDARRLDAELVSGRYFETLGTRTALGRLIEPADDLASAAPVVVVSRAFFRSELGADRSLIGAKDLALDGRTYRLIGIAPAGFTGATRRGIDLWLPLEVAAATSFPLSKSAYTVRWLNLIGRLDPGWTAAVADQLATDAFIAAGTERPSPDRTWTIGRNSAPVKLP